MKGRKPGQIELSIDDIVIIIDMTQSNKYSRRQIAEAIDRSMNTVFRYQKYFGLL